MTGTYSNAQTAPLLLVLLAVNIEINTPSKKERDQSNAVIENMLAAELPVGLKRDEEQ